MPSGAYNRRTSISVSTWDSDRGKTFPRGRFDSAVRLSLFLSIPSLGGGIKNGISPIERRYIQYITCSEFRGLDSQSTRRSTEHISWPFRYFA